MLRKGCSLELLCCWAECLDNVRAISRCIAALVLVMVATSALVVQSCWIESHRTPNQPVPKPNYPRPHCCECKMPNAIPSWTPVRCYRKKELANAL